MIWSRTFRLAVVTGLLLAGCANRGMQAAEEGPDGSPGAGGIPAAGGRGGSGGTPATGGSTGTGGTPIGTGGRGGGGGTPTGTGGVLGTGGMIGTGGTPATGGTTGAGGTTGTGGTAATGGTTGTGGMAGAGGKAGTGGMVATGGSTGTGGVVGTGGAAGGRGGAAGSMAGTGGAAGGAGGKGGAGANMCSGGGVLDCSSAGALTLPSGSVTSFSAAEWNATTAQFCDADGLRGRLFSYEGTATGSTATALVDTTAQNLKLNVTAKDWAGGGVIFESCADLSAYKSLSFTASLTAGSLSGCSWQVQLQTQDQRSSTDTDPTGGTCASNCYRYPAAQLTTTPSATGTPYTVAFTSFSNPSTSAIATPTQVVGVQWQVTSSSSGGCTAELRLDNIKFQ